MTRFLYLIREALVSLRRNVLVVVGAVLAVFISLSLAFGALVVNEVLRRNTIAWQQGVHVIAWLNDEGAAGVPANAHQTLLDQISSWEEVKNATYCDKACAYAEYQEIFAGNPDLLEIMRDPSRLPASIRIELVDIDFLSSVQFRLAEQQQVVFRVSSAAEQIKQLQNLSSVLNVFGIGLAVVLGLSAVVLIANTIRLAIYARRDEVEIMRLVGASNWYIRVPFLLEGLIEGVTGAAASVFVVWFVSTRAARLAESFPLVSLFVPNEFFLRWGLLFLVFGALAGVLGSLLGLSRYLRESDSIGAEVPTGVA